MEEDIFSIEYIIENELDKKVYGFIYITTNMVNNRKYIGKRVFDRNKKWKYYLGSGIALKNAVKFYNRDNFHRKIIALAYSKEELNDLEIKSIKKYNAVESENYYNISFGGTGGDLNSGRGFSEETKKKVAKVTKGSNNPFYGKQHSSESKLKMSESSKGKIHSLKTIEKLKIIRSGRYDLSSKVICLNDNIIFNSIKDGALYYGNNRPDISACCKGKLKSAGKHPITGGKLRWMYYDEYIKLQEAN